MVSVRVQSSIFVILAAGLLCLGYLCGRRAASGGQEDALGGLFSSEKETAHADYDPSQLTDDLLKQLNKARVSVARSPSTVRSEQVADLHVSILGALDALSSSFHAPQHVKLQRALGVLKSVDERLYAAWRAVVPLAAERLSSGRGSRVSAMQAFLRNASSAKSPGTWLLNVMVRQAPFGMHIKRGSVEVVEVFPGFPAQQVGVRKGCKLKEIAHQVVTSGTWLEIFQVQSRQLPKRPFAMKLVCSRQPTKRAGSGSGGALAEIEHEHRYRVMVVKKPYGMNVQVNTVPRVVEVLPGSPAEAAGIRPGFVLTEVNEVAVDMKNWFEQYQAAKLPFTLTFDPKVPVHSNNSYFKYDEGEVVPVQRNSSYAKSDNRKTPEEGSNHTERVESVHKGQLALFKCTVQELPFGMQVKALPGMRPLVVGVLPDKPAFHAGVRIGDELLEVAGRNVSWQTWFVAMQQAVTPYGLVFQRAVGSSTGNPSTR
mmetsp:Transcript_84701/g.196935  ORF Transcript_84701/g.196935 Transcript_84701/m.196935 type:complete len:483 (-) Transcript_84701:129-1577(-)